MTHKIISLSVLQSEWHAVFPTLSRPLSPDYIHATIEFLGSINENLQVLFLSSHLYKTEQKPFLDTLTHSVLEALRDPSPTFQPILKIFKKTLTMERKQYRFLELNDTPKSIVSYSHLSVSDQPRFLQIVSTIHNQTSPLLEASQKLPLTSELRDLFVESILLMAQMKFNLIENSPLKAAVDQFIERLETHFKTPSPHAHSFWTTTLQLPALILDQPWNFTSSPTTSLSGTLPRLKATAFIAHFLNLVSGTILNAPSQETTKQLYKTLIEIEYLNKNWVPTDSFRDTPPEVVLKTLSSQLAFQNDPTMTTPHLSLRNSLLNVDGRQFLIRQISGFLPYDALFTYLTGLTQAQQPASPHALRDSVRKLIVHALEYREFRKTKISESRHSGNTAYFYGAIQTAQRVFNQISHSKESRLLQVCKPMSLQPVTRKAFNGFNDMTTQQIDNLFQELQQKSILITTTDIGEKFETKGPDFQQKFQNALPQIFQSHTLLIYSQLCSLAHRGEDITPSVFVGLHGITEADSQVIYQALLKDNCLQQQLTFNPTFQIDTLSLSPTQKETLKIIFTKHTQSTGHALYVHVKPSGETIEFVIVNGGPGQKYHPIKPEESASIPPTDEPLRLPARYHAGLSIPTQNEQAIRGYLAYLLSLEGVRLKGPNCIKLKFETLYNPHLADFSFWKELSFMTSKFLVPDFRSFKPLDLSSRGTCAWHDVQIMGNCSIYNLNHAIRYAHQLNDADYAHLQMDIVKGMAYVIQ